MEVSAIKHMGVAGAHGRSPLLRLQSDERLVALVRRGNQHAFEALVARYQSRLLAFCRHMLSSREDAEDVLQDVFAAAFNAMTADDRPINVRPWLYRIARNRSLNHLRRAQAVGVDSMDVHFSEGGISTADKVHRREDFRMLITDVQDLPETQRTALLLREIDALSYEQIAEAMDNTVPSVKSLLVRARVALAEAAEARTLDCDAVRFELGEVAEGLKRTSAPVRRHLRSCERCASFRKQLASTNRALAALMPAGPLLLLKKALLAQLGTTAAASGGAAAAVGGSSAAGGVLGIGVHTAATKAAAGLAAAAIVTAGAVEVKHVAVQRDRAPVTVATTSADDEPSAPTEAVTAGQPAPGQTLEVAPILTADARMQETERLARLAEARRADETPAATADPAAIRAEEESAAPAAETFAVPPLPEVPVNAGDPAALTGEAPTTSPPTGPTPMDTRVGRPVAGLPFPLLDPSSPVLVMTPVAPAPAPSAPTLAPAAAPTPAPAAPPTPAPVAAPEPAPAPAPEPEPEPATAPASAPEDDDPAPQPTPQPDQPAGAPEPRPEPAPAEPAAGGQGDPDPAPAEPAPEPAADAEAGEPAGAPVEPADGPAPAAEPAPAADPPG